jgi:phosphate acyltransferase
MAAGAFEAVREKMDPRTRNGGVFLGLNGVVVKSHGGTDAFGFASAIDVAVDMVENRIVEKIAADMAVKSSVAPGPVAEAGAGL